jgi:predicted RNA-binding Zn-ribbon protein involved in translation (DUF1610 family)
MPEAVCIKCSVALKPETNGVSVAEMFQGDTEFYRIRQADLWSCPGCGMQVILGFADNGVEHWEEGFAQALKNHILALAEGKGYAWNEHLKKESGS